MARPFWQTINPWQKISLFPAQTRGQRAPGGFCALRRSLLLWGWLGWLLVGWSSGAIAGTLIERLAQFPDWEARPPVQAAAGDLYYPDWFRGTWDVITTLVDLAAPLAPAVTTPGFEKNRQFLNQPIPFQARFVPVDRPPLPQSFGFLRPLPQIVPVVADRAFNGRNLARAYLDDPTHPENSPVVDVKVDPTNPNRQLTILQGDRRLISTVSARATETPDPAEFVTSEIFQQEFRRSNQLYLNQVETTTRYTRLQPSREGDPSITADQVTAIYLSPQDPEFDQAGDRPVALYRYSLTFVPAS